MVTKKTISLLFGVFLLCLAFQLFSFASAAEPTGANFSVLSTGTAPNDTAGSNEAYAGNVTQLKIFGYTTTQSWQGYYGNVTGVIQLADNNDYVMYNWSIANPAGEIYASTNSTILWQNIQCFNYTATGSYTAESGQGGTTNLYGANLTIIHQRFNISENDPDNLNNTFYLGPNDVTNGHDLFFTANKRFDTGECLSTRIFGNGGVQNAREFEEVLLYEPVTTSLIFASLLHRNDVVGFDGAIHDFEMIVLENGHGVDMQTTTYYFFVELE